MERLTLISQLKSTIEENIDTLSKQRADFAIYRFGHFEQPEHNRRDTSNHFLISPDRVRVLENSVIKETTGRPIQHWYYTFNRKHYLKDFLE